MKHILVCFFILCAANLFAQQKLNEKIDEGIELYESGRKKRALAIWKQVEKDALSNSSTYGTALNNILYYYVQSNKENQMLKYYHKIINSTLNDKDENFEIGKPYKNYRFHANMRLASYYGKKKEYKKSLTYVNKADHNTNYETSSLTDYIYQKVDLAFWKFRLYNDLGEKDKATSVLIKRAFEYQYGAMYPEWATLSFSTSEMQLAEAICAQFDNISDLKQEIDIAIQNLIFDKGNNQILLKINNTNYEINLYSTLSNEEDCRAYLRNSLFYDYLVSNTNE